MASEMVTMNDGTQLYTQHWPAEEPRATLLIVHGISEHSGRWQHVGEHYAGLGYDVHCYDQRSHGRSGDGVIDITAFDLFLDDVSERMEAVREPGRPIVLLGHSMGGLIVTAYLESSRQKPDAAVLSAPALSAEVPAIQRFLAKVLSKIIPKLSLKSSIRGDQLSSDPSIGEAYFADPLVYLKVTTRFANLLLSEMDTVRASVASISTPTLVVHGSADSLVPAWASEPLDSVAGVERIVFDDLRHEMHNEPEADEVFAAIAEWLDTALVAGDDTAS